MQQNEREKKSSLSITATNYHLPTTTYLRQHFQIAYHEQKKYHCIVIANLEPNKVKQSSKKVNC